jgi:uncharacterized protein (TIGR03118 family)
MKQISFRTIFKEGLIPLFILIFLNLSCKKNFEKNADQKIAPASLSSEKVPQSLKDFTQVNLIGDEDEYHPARIDAALVNGWGISFSPGGIVWISAEATGKSLVVTKDGSQVLPPVSIPSPTDTIGGHPTGQVFNGSTSFRLPNGNPARFIFAGADGVLSGWNGGTSAKKMVDNSATASYLGIALASNAGKNYLYAANFKDEGQIDVFDSTWTQVPISFTDPNLPEDYYPFNIQAIDNMLFVMYAKIGADGDEIAHPGFGIVDIYNPDGSFVKRFISHGQLNAPWGIAKAPPTFYGSQFGNIPNTYLVGNFGDGHINAYSWDGTFLGQLRGHGVPIEIEGLWGISFAPASATSVDPNRLFFAAGPDDEEHGLFGYIVK